MGKERVQTRVDPDTNDQIESFAEDNNLTQSEAIRRIIRAGLAQKGYPVAAADGGVNTKSTLEKIASPKAMVFHTAVLSVGLLLLELAYILFQAGGTTLPLATLALSTVAMIAATVGVVLSTLAQLALARPLRGLIGLSTNGETA